MRLLSKYSGQEESDLRGNPGNRRADCSDVRGQLRKRGQRITKLRDYIQGQRTRLSWWQGNLIIKVQENPDNVGKLKESGNS